ncbi:hypothetical protein GE09DRAFT_675800 [Coniochaeta sp. 2T2.1]|nr:hypothetical protein GE09DRAFT_675800 [Coniochaeta sp. 2T2.1]
MNFNVTVPVGTVNHGVSNLICTPPKWNHYIIFFLTNYVAHAASLPASPGECWQETIVNVATALFVPGYGVLRALRGLYLHARLSEKDELDCAARSGALAMIVRSRMLSDPDESHLFREKFRGEATRVPWQGAIFGRCDIGPKYRDYYSLVTVPHDTPLTEKLAVGAADRTATPRTAESTRDIRLAYTYNIPKILVAAFQAVWGSITLYKARGDRLERYGYAAFGLSVAPYVFMSLVNIATSLVTPDYPVMYLVHTPDME